MNALSELKMLRSEGALEQHAGPVPALLRDCCRALRHKGFAYAEAWTRERISTEHDRALQRLQSVESTKAAEPELGPAQDDAGADLTSVKLSIDLSASSAKDGNEASPGCSVEHEPNGADKDAAGQQAQAQTHRETPFDPLPETSANARLSALIRAESYEDVDAELSHMLSFNGHSAAVRSMFTRGGQQLKDLERFRDSAQDAGYMQNCSIPGICWDNAKLEMFDLRKQFVLDQSIRDDPRTALAKVLFDVVISVPVYDVTHKNTVVAVLVFYRLRDSGKDTPGKRYAVEDSLRSFLDKSASVFPLALNLQCSHAKWQDAMQDCKMHEIDHSLVANSQKYEDCTHAGTAQDEENGASTAAPNKPVR